MIFPGTDVRWWPVVFSWFIVGFVYLLHFHMFVLVSFCLVGHKFIVLVFMALTPKWKMFERNKF